MGAGVDRHLEGAESEGREMTPRVPEYITIDVSPEDQQRLANALPNVAFDVFHAENLFAAHTRFPVIAYRSEPKPFARIVTSAEDAREFYR